MKRGAIVVIIIAALGVAGFLVARNLSGPSVAAPPKPDAALAMDTELRQAIDAAHANALANPSDPATRATLAMVYDASRMFAEAKTTYEQAIALDPNNAEWRYHLARMEKELGDTARAMAAIDEAAARAPTQFVIPVRTGMWLLETGDAAGAEAKFRKALQLKPDSLSAKHGLSRALVEQGKNAEAVQLLEQLRLAIPADSTVHQLLGRCYMQMGRTEDGTAELSLGVGSKWNWTVEDPWLDDVLKMRRGYRARYETAMNYVEIGAPARAIPILEELRTQNAGDVPVVLLLCSAYDATGQIDRALDVLQKVEMQQGEHFAIKLNLAHFYQLKGDLSRAMRYTDEAIALHPKLAAAHVQKAQIYITQKQYDLAEQSADEALRCDANDVQARFVKAQTLLSRNRFAEAEKVLGEAVHSHPAVAQGFAMLAVAQFNVGKRTEAMASLAHAERLNPNDPTAKTVRDGIARLQQTPGNR